MRRRKGNNKPSGRAIAAQRLRDTTECRCGSYKPALITRSVEVKGKIKVIGYCEDCIGRR